MLKNIKFEEVSLEKATYLVLKEGIERIKKYGLSVHIETCTGCGYFIRLTKVKGTGLVIALSHEKGKYYLLKDEDNFNKLVKIIDNNYRGDFDFVDVLLLPNDFHKCVKLSSVSINNINHVWDSGYLSLSVSPEDFKDAASIRCIFTISKIASLKFIGDKGDVSYQIS